LRVYTAQRRIAALAVMLSAQKSADRTSGPW
jgi:hypothetical protein